MTKAITIITIVVFILVFLLLIFGNWIGIAYYGGKQTIYGLTSPFERLMNPQCPSAVYVHVFDYDKQCWKGYANSIITCRDKHWFDSWAVESAIRGEC